MSNSLVFVYHLLNIRRLLRKYEADYLATEKNPHKAKYEMAVQYLFHEFHDTQILFADEVTKISRGGEPQNRIFVVTDKNIYKENPKTYKVKNFEGTENAGIPIVDVTGVRYQF